MFNGVDINSNKCSEILGLILENWKPCPAQRIQALQSSAAIIFFKPARVSNSLPTTCNFSLKDVKKFVPIT